MKLVLHPRQAWEPISTGDWTAARARHLFRRASWATVPEQIDEALRMGPFATVERMFGRVPSMARPERAAEVGQEQRRSYQRARAAASPEERRKLQQEARQRAVAAYQEMTVDWLQFASRPQNAPYEKWVTFLQNIFVVSFDRVRNPDWLYRHHDLLRQHGTGSYRDLCRAVSRSPAMVLYLDLQQSKVSAPNENFARELSNCSCSARATTPKTTSRRPPAPSPVTATATASFSSTATNRTAIRKRSLAGPDGGTATM